MTLDDVAKIMTRVQKPMDFSDPDSAKDWLVHDPFVLTDKGYGFKGNPEMTGAWSDDNYAEIGTKIEIPEGEDSIHVRDNIPLKIVHEAQHMFDRSDRDPKTLMAMKKDYKDNKKKYGSDFHNKYPAELRAIAREILTVYKMAYDRIKSDKKEATFEEYLKRWLPIVRSGGDKRIGKYIYKFINDELADRIGIEDIPSDISIKNIDDSIKSFRF